MPPSSRRWRQRHLRSAAPQIGPEAFRHTPLHQREPRLPAQAGKSRTTVKPTARRPQLGLPSMPGGGANRREHDVLLSLLHGSAWPRVGRGTAERPGSRPGLERNTKPRNDCSSIRDLLVLHRHDHREPGATRWCQNAATAIAARPVPIRWLGMEGCSLQGGGVAEGRVHPPVRLDHAMRGSRVCRGGRPVRMPFTEPSGQTRFQRAEIPWHGHASLSSDDNSHHPLTYASQRRTAPARVRRVRAKRPRRARPDLLRQRRVPPRRCRLALRDHRGREAVFRLFDVDRGAAFTSEIHDVLANDRHAIALTHVHGSRADRTLDDITVHVVHVIDGRITEAWIFPGTKRRATPSGRDRSTTVGRGAVRIRRNQTELLRLLESASAARIQVRGLPGLP